MRKLAVASYVFIFYLTHLFSLIGDDPSVNCVHLGLQFDCRYVYDYVEVNIVICG